MNRTPRGRLLVLAAAVGLGLAPAGCAHGPRVYVNPQADPSYYGTIAVLPFVNLTPNAYAGERVTRALVTELVMSGRYKVLEPGPFMAELDKIGGRPDREGIVDPQKLKDAAAAVGATGVLRGGVSEYQTQRAGQEDFPVVTFDVELVDAPTGNVVWRTSVSRRGRGRLPLIGGPGSRSFGELTQDACREVVSALARKGF